MGITDQTFYRWRLRPGALKEDEVRPQYGFHPRNSKTIASSSPDIWCGQLVGRCDRSPSSSSPPASYQLS